MQPRWGKVGKQKIEDAGTLYPKRMETVDDEILDHTFKFIDKAKARRQAVLRLAQPDAHARRHPPLREVREDADAGERLVDLRGRHGAARRHRRRGHEEARATWASTDDTIVVFTTDNGAENFTWPDGGQTPFAGGKGTVLEGGFRVPCIVRWPGKVPAGKVENGIMSGLDWFPTFVAAAGNPNIVEELKKGKELGDTTYKVHLDGYDQTDLITGKGPSKRHEIFYFAEGTLGAVRIDDYKYRFIDQPSGWLGGTVKVDWPILVNLRLDPFERTGLTGSLELLQLVHATSSGASSSSSRRSAKFGADRSIEFPPMQKGASFNLEAVKEQIQKAIQSHAGK